MRSLIVLGSLLAAIGCESAVVGAKCRESFSRCGDECVNLKRDFRLCRGFICSDGECQDPASEPADAGSSDAASD
jgi:hypothetical protein